MIKIEDILKPKTIEDKMKELAEEMIRKGEKFCEKQKRKYRELYGDKKPY